ncbi:hypothetical protein [Vibrio genomosp. F10]|uniref:hypothetical protein n=1 Tax=Vibrio genomosp. F10 TaxID=723171 RepID=UPI00114CCD92|nr:hypothetical protein [Vibrio genomosp. F10]
MAKEIVLILLIGGLTAFGHPYLRKVLYIGIVSLLLIIYLESKLRDKPIFSVARKFLIPIGLNLGYHSFVLTIHLHGKPIEVALYSVAGVVCLLIYVMTIPFTK